jgi:hypothetical protein
LADGRSENDGIPLFQFRLCVELGGYEALYGLSDHPNMRSAIMSLAEGIKGCV